MGMELYNILVFLPFSLSVVQYVSLSLSNAFTSVFNASYFAPSICITAKYAANESRPLKTNDYFL